MSKKRVQDALRHAAARNWTAVDAILSSVDRQFVVKRLEHYLRQTRPPEGADALSRHMGLDRILRTPGRGWPTAAEASETVGNSMPQPSAVHESTGALDMEDGATLLDELTMSEASQQAVDISNAVPKIILDDPAPFLSAVTQANGRVRLNLEKCRVVQVWGLVGIAVLCRRNGIPRGEVELERDGKVSKFAVALGLREVIEDRVARPAQQPGRTVRLRRVRRFNEVEPVAAEVSRLILGERNDENTRRTIYYVLVELLRNVVQHSRDRLGGVVAAQLMTSGQKYRHEAVQVAVCDAGIGIPASLRSMHPQIHNAREALEKALWPHFSGTFQEGLTGSIENAGMGLFFIAEMAKLTAGRLLVASRGAALTLLGDEGDLSRHRLDFVEPPGVGFPGTLVSFELPLGRVSDHAVLLQQIRTRAKERIPARAVHRWFVFAESAPPGAAVFDATVHAEDTAEAQRFAKVLLDHLTARRPVAIDFRQLAIGTQSYLHALLYEPLRIAWALRTPIFVLNAEPAVRSGLEHLESYALGG